jgi:hypothetical protein
MTVKGSALRAPARRILLAVILLLALCGSAQAGINVWSGTGPFTPVAGHRAVYALAISSDGTVLYSGLDTGTVMSLTFGPVPIVASVTPATGPETGGTTVTIAGSGFTGATAVRFGTADATSYTVVSGTEITATSPAGTAGTVDVRVTTPGGTSITNSGDVFTYTGPATHLSVTAATPWTAGVPFTFTVTVLDALDHQAADYTGTVHFTSSDASATLPADATLTGGTGEFSATLMAVGSQTITATDTVTGTITGTSAGITVEAGPATHFTVTAPATSTAATSFSIAVTAIDVYGNTATGYTGTVHFTSTDGAADLPADTTLTSGVGSFGTTLNTAGTQTITATDTVTGTITGTCGDIAVSPGPAARFVVTAPPSATAGTPFTFTVTALDAGGNTDPGYTGTVHFTSSDGSATLPADSALAAGTGTFGAMLATAGTQTLTATDTVTPAVTGASGTIAVGPAPATYFTVTAPASATTGTAIGLTVTALDPYGNRDTAYAGTVHFTATDTAAAMPADGTLVAGTRTFNGVLWTTGTWTVTATDTLDLSVTGTSGTITVIAPVVPTTTPTANPTPGPDPLTDIDTGNGGTSGTGGSDGTGTGFPLITVTVNIGGDSKAWQAIVTGTSLGDLIVTGTVQHDGGENATAPPGTVFQYLSLVPARYGSITQAAIRFTVPQSWLDENGIPPGSIVLYHLTANGWEALPTTFLYAKDGTAYFSAQSSGFSVFAITGAPGAAAPVATATQSPVLNTPAQATAPAAVAKAPVSTQTTAPPAPVQAPAASTPIPVVPVIAVLFCAALIGGGWYVRRWWIRRQNPALFREYD